MIVFDLLCDVGHRFEGWFSSAIEFDRQRAGGLVSCPQCGGHEVARIPSATRVNTGAAEVGGKSEDSSAAHGEKTPVSPDPAGLAQALYARMVDEVLRKSEDVGSDFPDEARRIHYEEASRRPIRGLATQEEHEALLDEGIPVARLPIPPGGRLN